MASNVNHRERLLLLQQEAERLRQETEQQTRLADLQDVIAHDQARYDVLRDELSKVKIRIRENVVAYEDLQHGDGSAMTVCHIHGCFMSSYSPFGHLGARCARRESEKQREGNHHGLRYSLQ